MIVRTLTRCSTTRPRILQACRPRLAKARARTFSTSSFFAASTPQAPPHPSSMLGIFTNELDKIAPRFDIQGSQIQILRSPAEFYETLKAKILKAEREIFLSALYIGKTEHELISTLQQALRSKPKLKLYILTDALRGTRESPDPSCASLLAPLVTEFGSERVGIRMYHTPNLTGVRKEIIPKRINEGWGLQHMKLYGIDDEIIMSGANLSNDYFTNRQDRYHVFSSREITDYFFKIYKAVSRLSFLLIPAPQVTSGYLLQWPSSNSAPSPLEDPSTYISRSSKILTPLLQPYHSPKQPPSSASHSENNTTVYPISQLTPLLRPHDTSTELPAITSILRLLSLPTTPPSSWTFTAGYFNPDPSLTSTLISTASTHNTVITASPWANGFFSSPGISGLLPAAYTLLSKRFLLAAQKAGKGVDITLKEWRRGKVGEEGGWTYHAKGLWVALNGEKGASVSVVGSSNYTKRSYGLDLETGVVVVTGDEGLKGRLGEERAGLEEYAERVGMEEFGKRQRRVGIRVRVAMWVVKMVGGAL